MKNSLEIALFCLQLAENGRQVSLMMVYVLLAPEAANIQTVLTQVEAEMFLYKKNSDISKSEK